MPVCVVGRITNIDEAEEILASGKADMVAMCRALVADQELVAKAKFGQGSRDPALSGMPGLLVEARATAVRCGAPSTLRLDVRSSTERSPRLRGRRGCW